MTKATERSRAPVEEVPIHHVIVGPRRRKRLGKIKQLQTDIEKRGLINPITIRSDNMLVTGYRRLEAFRRLGRRKIPARNWGDLSDEELHGAEFAENEYREPFTEAEKSEETMRKIEAIEFEADQELSGPGPGKSKEAHRPVDPKSDEQIASKLGVTATTVARTRAHVDSFDRYGFLRENWGKKDAIAAAKTLDGLRAPVRKTAVALCSERGVHKKHQVAMLKNLPKLSVERQDEIVKLYASNRPHRHDVAQAMAMKMPPPPDPAMGTCGEIRDLARKGKAVTELEELRPRFDELYKIAGEMISAARKDLEKRR
jgi:hypothetical protein